MLQEVVASARAQHPVTLLVCGEAGIGKTRLISEVASGLASQDVLLTGNAVDLAGGEMPFGVLSGSLRGAIQRRGLDTVRAWAGTAAPVLSTLVPELAPEAHAVAQPLAVIDAFAGLLSRLSAVEFVWWAVEDLHWADEASRDALRYVVQLMQPPAKLLVTCTLRTHDVPLSASMSTYVSEVVRAPAARRIDLHRLTADQVAVQLSALRNDVGTSLVARVMQLSDGIPFLAEELVAGGLKESGPLPSSARDLMLARVESLDTNTRAVLRAASLAETHLQDDMLGTITGLGALETEEALSEAVRVGILDVDESSDGYRFHHSLMRQALAGSLLPSEGARWHRAWAEALSGDSGLEQNLALRVEAAHHWLAAGVKDRAFASAMAAARAADVVGAQGERAAMLCSALELWPSLPARQRTGLVLDEIVEEAIWACGMSGRIDGGLQMLDRRLMSRDEGDDGELRRLRLTLARARLARFVSQEGGHEPERAALDTHIALLERSPRSLLFARVVAELLADAQDVETNMALADLLTEALTTVTRDGSPFDRIDMQDLYAHHVKVLGRYEESAELHLALLSDAERLLSWSDQVRLESNAISRLCDVGRFRYASEIGRRSLKRFSDPLLAPRLWVNVAGNLCAVLIEIGDWDEADRYLTRIKDLAATGWQAVDAWLVSAVLSCRRGHLDAAVQMLEEADRVRNLTSEAPDLLGGRELAKAEIALTSGDPDRAWGLVAPAWVDGGVPGSWVTRHSIMLAARAAARASSRRRSPTTDGIGRRVAELRRTLDGFPQIPTDLDAVWRAHVNAELSRCLGEDTSADWGCRSRGTSHVGPVV